MSNQHSNHYICQTFSSDTLSSDTRYSEVHGDGPEFIQSNVYVVHPSSSAAPLTSEELVRLLHQALAPAKSLLINLVVAIELNFHLPGEKSGTHKAQQITTNHINWQNGS